MCGICNLFRCGNSRRNSCGCNDSAFEPVCVRRTQPSMNIHCASGVGTASERPCGCRERNTCGPCCRRENNCEDSCCD